MKITRKILEKQIKRGQEIFNGFMIWNVLIMAINIMQMVAVYGCGNVLIVKVESLDGIRGIFSFRFV